MNGINEGNTAALTLISAAQDFLLEYLKREEWYEHHHRLAAAAADAVFTASYVDTYAKHDLLTAVHEKLKRAGAEPGSNPAH
jgi:hypothetical protein